MGFFGRVTQGFVLPVADVVEPDIVIFAIKPAKCGLIIQCKPMCPDTIRIRCGVFDIATIGLAAAGLCSYTPDT